MAAASMKSIVAGLGARLRASIVTYSEADRDYDARPLVCGDQRSSVVPGSIGHGGPGQLGRSEAGGSHLHERVADRGPRIRGVPVDEALDALETLRLLHGYGFHRTPSTSTALAGLPTWRSAPDDEQ